MAFLKSKFLLAALLLLGGSSLLWAQPRHPAPDAIHDAANLFSKDAIQKANELITKINSSYKKDFVVETLNEGPKEGVDPQKWARERFKSKQINGVYVVIYKLPKAHLEVEVGDHTRTEGDFSIENSRELASMMVGRLKTKKYDDALTEGTEYVLGRFRAQAKPVRQAQNNPVPPVVAHHNAEQNDLNVSKLFGGFGWLCPVIAIGLVFWVIFAVIKGITRSVGGGGGGGPGYAGGGGGYGGGGGGGGFFSSMLGGLFGAAGGMWLYNNMFGGHQNYSGSSPTSNDYSNPSTPDTDATGTGGDWDDKDQNAGGGDTGAGGDWGDSGGGDAGGGDAGGGGDWGGGGGGGGDWGGGGGGGDFGGGGGGGDW